MSVRVLRSCRCTQEPPGNQCSLPSQSINTAVVYQPSYWRVPGGRVRASALCVLCSKQKLVSILKEEAAKAGLDSTVQRLDPTLPKDLSNLTVAKLKEELKKRGFPTSGLKAVLVDRLTGAVASEVPAQRPKPGPKTPNTYQYQPTSNSRQQ